MHTTVYTLVYMCHTYLHMRCCYKASHGAFKFAVVGRSLSSGRVGRHLLCVSCSKLHAVGLQNPHMHRDQWRAACSIGDGEYVYAGIKICTRLYIYLYICVTPYMNLHMNRCYKASHGAFKFAAAGRSLSSGRLGRRLLCILQQITRGRSVCRLHTCRSMACVHRSAACSIRHGEYVYAEIKMRATVYLCAIYMDFQYI
jgi:hypothetical protein